MGHALVVHQQTEIRVGILLELLRADRRGEARGQAASNVGDVLLGLAIVDLEKQVLLEEQPLMSVMPPSFIGPWSTTRQPCAVMATGSTPVVVSSAAL
jgi:hypothetical protein